MKNNSELVRVIFRTEAADTRSEIAVGPFFYLDGVVDYILDPIKDIEPIRGMRDDNMSQANLAALKGRKPIRNSIVATHMTTFLEAGLYTTRPRNPHYLRR